MENLESLVKKLAGLRGKTFTWKKKQYYVKRAEYRNCLFVVFTSSNYLTFEQARFIEFLKEIVIEEEYEVLTIKTTIMNTELQQVNASVQVAETMTSKLVDMFNVLSGNPTEEDYKKAEAMSRVVHTIVSVEQTKINYLKLKDRV